MRPVHLQGTPQAGREADWLMDAIREIESASADADIGELADAYSIAHAPTTPVRSLDCATATLANVRDFLGTLITDLQKRGTHRGQ